MNPAVRNIIAVVVGFVVGSAVNIGIVMVGPSIIPPPAGVDVTDAASIASSMHLFEPKHFITPFLAHAIGTFTGALVALKISASDKPIVAWIRRRRRICRARKVQRPRSAGTPGCAWRADLFPPGAHRAADVVPVCPGFTHRLSKRRHYDT